MYWCNIIIRLTGIHSNITSTKYQVPVVTLSINDNIKYLEKFLGINIDQKQDQNPKLTTFRSFNRLFFQLFKLGENYPTRNYSFKNYIPLAEIKNCNALIDNKPFFNQPVKKQKASKKLVEMSRNDYYTTINLLGYLYHERHYKRIGIDLSRETNTTFPQQTNFVEKLEEEHGATIFVIPENRQTNYSKPFFRFTKFN